MKVFGSIRQRLALLDVDGWNRRNSERFFTISMSHVRSRSLRIRRVGHEQSYPPYTWYTGWRRDIFIFTILDAEWPVVAKAIRSPLWGQCDSRVAVIVGISSCILWLCIPRNMKVLMWNYPDLFFFSLIGYSPFLPVLISFYRILLYLYAYHS